MLRKKLWLPNQQPNFPVEIDPSNPVGGREWALVQVGSSPPILSADTPAILTSPAGPGVTPNGRALQTTTDGSGGSVTHGNAVRLQLSTQSGIISFIPTTLAVNAPLYTSHFTSNTTQGGFYVGVATSGFVTLAKQDVAVLVETSNVVRLNSLNTVSWSYNAATGRAQVALNGVLTSATTVATLTHGITGRFRYYDNLTTASAAHSQLLFALSPIEIFSGTILLAASNNPWQIFRSKSSRVWVAAAAVGGSDGQSSGAATVSGAAISQALGAGSLSGLSATTGSSLSRVLATGSSAGASTSSSAAISQALAIGSSAGVAAVSGVTSAQAISIGSSSGAATISGASDTAGAGSTGSASGSAIVSGIAAARALAVGSSSGVAVVSGASDSAGAGSVGSSIGGATVSGVTAYGIISSGASAGNAAITGIGSARFLSVGASSGLSVVSGVSEGTAIYLSPTISDSVNFKRLVSDKFAA